MTKQRIDTDLMKIFRKVQAEFLRNNKKAPSIRKLSKAVAQKIISKNVDTKELYDAVIKIR